MSVSRRRLLKSSIALPAGALGFAASSSERDDQSDSDQVGNTFFTMTNSAGGNEIVAYRFKRRGANASLHESQRISAGGQGAGSGLGSQGALALNTERTALLAVNAGSNTVSMLQAGVRGLLHAATAPSGGERPIAVTECDGFVYVLNAMGTPNISGLVVNGSTLQPLAGSTRTLPAGSAPAQVSFSPDGNHLVVSLRATNQLLVFPVNAQGIAGAAVTSPSAGMTPFGFAFTNSGVIVVSEAFGGAPNASTVSTYEIRDNGTLAVISNQVALQQSAACWVAMSPGSRYAFTTNTGSGSLSSLRIRSNGAATLVPGPSGPAIAASPGAPIDAATRGRALAVLSGSSTRHVDLFDIDQRTGSITLIAQSGGLPAEASGIA
jgi:6-phosphogluconolactonase (cycloisomerase 2 family)